MTAAVYAHVVPAGVTILVNGVLSGLTPGNHGFHVHAVSALLGTTRFSGWPPPLLVLGLRSDVLLVKRSEE